MTEPECSTPEELWHELLHASMAERLAILAVLIEAAQVLGSDVADHE